MAHVEALLRESVYFSFFLKLAVLMRGQSCLVLPTRKPRPSPGIIDASQQHSGATGGSSSRTGSRLGTTSGSQTVDSRAQTTSSAARTATTATTTARSTNESWTTTSTAYQRRKTLLSLLCDKLEPNNKRLRGKGNQQKGLKRKDSFVDELEREAAEATSKVEEEDQDLFLQLRGAKKQVGFFSNIKLLAL